MESGTELFSFQTPFREMIPLRPTPHHKCLYCSACEHPVTLMLRHRHAPRMHVPCVLHVKWSIPERSRAYSSRHPRNITHAAPSLRGALYRDVLCGAPECPVRACGRASVTVTEAPPSPSRERTPASRACDGRKSTPTSLRRCGISYGCAIPAAGRSDIGGVPTAQRG